MRANIAAANPRDPPPRSPFAGYRRDPPLAWNGLRAKQPPRLLRTTISPLETGVGTLPEPSQLPPPLLRSGDVRAVVVRGQDRAGRVGRGLDLDVAAARDLGLRDPDEVRV